MASPKPPEVVKAERSVKRVAKLIDQLRAGEENWDQVQRALNLAYDHANVAAGMGYPEPQEQVLALHREVGPAESAGREARMAARAAEIRRLREEERGPIDPVYAGYRREVREMLEKKHRRNTSPRQREQARMALAGEGDFDDEESVLIEMGRALSIDPEELTIDEDGRGFSHFGAGTFWLIESGSKGWVVGRDDDAVRELAIEVVKQQLNDEPEIFSQSFLESHIDTERLSRDLRSDVHSSNFDQAQELASSPDEFWREAERFGMDVPEEDEDDEDWELPEPEYADIDNLADHMTDEQLKDPLAYLEDIYGKEDAVKQAIEIAGIDVDAAAEEAVNADGPIHFLGSYDGHEYNTPSGWVYWRTD